MQNLREYIEHNLPEPIEADLLLSFFEQPDVIDRMSQIERLIDELSVKWQKGQPIIVVEAGSVDVKAFNDSLTEQATTENQEVSCQGITAEMPISKFSEEQPIVVESITLPETFAIPEQTAEPMRFNPTNQSEQISSQPSRSIVIPNAMVGKTYSQLLDLGAFGLPDVAEHTLDVDVSTGLTYDNETQTISGKPAKSGEFKFVLTYRIKTSESDRPALTRDVQLLINPDPRSLWKDLPSDKNDQYFKPDSDQGFLSVDDVRLIAASVRGRSHAHEGKFRDDDFSLATLAETGWYMLSVADGAGSAPYSRRGAQLACQTVTDQLKTSVTPESWDALNTAVNQYVSDQREPNAGVVQRQLYEVLGKAVFAAYKAIETEAHTKGAVAKDFATTLITVLAKPVEGGWLVGAFWVGDGGVGIYREGYDPIVLGTPDGGEYAGQTRFLTMSETISNNFFRRFKIAFVPDITAIILMTDGVTDPKFQTDNNLNRKEKWDELWVDLKQSVSLRDDQQAPTQLQEWLTFWSPGNHDDRTIALLYLHANNDTN